MEKKLAKPSTYQNIVKFYVENIVKLHDMPSRIVSDRRTQFTSRFWKRLHKAMGTKLDFSSAYHPQTDGQTERVNQIMEDMLRAYVLTYGKNWKQSLPYAEFSYNNGYQASLGMSPFEAEKMQNSPDVVRSWRTCPSRARPYKGS